MASAVAIAALDVIIDEELIQRYEIFQHNNATKVVHIVLQIPVVLYAYPCGLVVAPQTMLLMPYNLGQTYLFVIAINKKSFIWRTLADRI